MLTAVKQSVGGWIDKNFNGDTMNFREIQKLFFPILVDQLLVAMLGLFNSSIVSSSGAEAVAAVSMIDSLNLFFMNFYIAIATGGTVVVAQYIGHRDKPMAGKSAAQAVISAFLMAILIGVAIIVFCDPLLAVLFGGAEPLVFSYGKIYLIGCCISYPFFAIYQAAAGALRGLGDTKASMILSVSLNLIYVLLNVLLINGLHLGVLGVAISLVVSRVLISVFSLFILVKARSDLNIHLKQFLHLDWSLQKRILYIGIPTATEQLFFHGGKLLTQTFIVSLGTVSMTANAISNTLASLYQVPGSTVNMLIVTVAGQCIGAGRPDEAKKFIKSLVTGSSLLLVLTVLIFTPLLPFIMGFFAVSPEIIDKCYNVMWVYLIGLPIFWSISFIVPSGLRAASDAKFTSVAALISMWSVRVVLGYVLGIVLGFDIEGVWAAMVIEWAVRAVIFGMRLHGDKWYRHKLIE